MALHDENLREKISKLPRKPGVYQYLDEHGTIIYIGKAKNIKKRVVSYLNKKKKSNRTLVMLTQIADIDCIVVNNEQDAFFLENNLIKEHQPKYNIRLKDDKSYPWICIKKESFPRIFITRNHKHDGSEYFGPYSSSKYAYALIALIKSLYKLRTCNLQLNSKSICANKFKVCLEYHIGNCLAPCIAKMQESEYNESIAQLRHILRGNFISVIEIMTQKMNDYAEMLRFEDANQMKEALKTIKNYKSKSTIFRTTINNTDVFSYIETEKYSYVNFIRVIHGAVNQVYTLEIERKIEEVKESLLSFAIYEIRQLVGSNSKEIIIPFYPDMQLEGIQYIIPQRGDKKQLLDLSERNANYFKLDRIRMRAPKADQIMKMMKLELKLPKIPQRMECFDNSNIQGTNPVAACVVFINGKAAKPEYRKYKIKTVEGADDYASMEEIIFRRYTSVVNKKEELPDLIVIDGGKGQLNSAIKSLKKLELYGKIPILGLAKGMEEIYFPEDKDPYILAKNSITLKTLMQIRDEAHRFGVIYHRKLRGKAQVKSILTDIKGIGLITETLLLQKFKTVNKIRSRSIEELASIVGKKKAEIIHQFFKI